jgi:D-alanyl-lipoteichoic acid acyltransferase DltB (MBOAT superfamily)
MNLSSFLYLVFFFFVTLIYFIFPKKVRWVWLLTASYLFCIYASPIFALVLLLVTSIAFGSGLLVARAGSRKGKLAWLLLGLFLTVIPLFIAKYLNFSISIIEDAVRVLGGSLDWVGFDILLPLGISFYTFQALSYLMDIYNDILKPEKNFARFALYQAFFPKLIAGPIERGGALLPQLLDPKPFDYQRMLDGLVRIGWGFFKKLVVADRLGVIVNTVYTAPGDFHSPLIILAVFAYSFQIYIDFSAYCDIAIGSAKILGIDLIENFNSPYFARSVTEFWRRWHISLTSWLRDYIFTPLNFAVRRKRARIYQYLIIIFVFLVSGLWHGANYTFIIWGLLHGLYQVVEAATANIRTRFAKRFSIDRESFGHRFFEVACTFLLVTFTWIFFRAQNIHEAGQIIRSIATLEGVTEQSGWALPKLGLAQPDLLIMLAGLIVVIIIQVAGHKRDLVRGLNIQPLPFRWLVYLTLIFAVIIFGYFGIYTAESFIYAGF